jgi:large subunit ribosomal protein L30
LKEFLKGKIKVTLVKGKSGHTKRQLRTLEALGLGKRTSSVEVETSPVINGMVSKVHHLVQVSEL